MVIVSASGSDVVGPIGEMLGADRVVASQLEIVDGHYTGEIEYYAYAEQKAAAIRELADECGYDLDASYAYSDSITDVHMLEVVGHPHAVNPDKELRRVAVARGWPVLVFTKPVALRSARLRSRDPRSTALAVGGRGRRGRRRAGPASGAAASAPDAPPAPPQPSGRRCPSPATATHGHDIVVAACCHHTSPTS